MHEHYANQALNHAPRSLGYAGKIAAITDKIGSVSDTTMRCVFQYSQVGADE